MVLEVCANSYLSAKNAQEAGAHRIELCSELALGGITPSAGLIQKVTSHLQIPVFVLIRPRSGDFTYTTDEFEIMLEDIAFCKSSGIQGIVSGVLLKDGTIDKHRTQKLIKASDGMSFTFHRAFDWVPDIHSALNTLIDLKVDRILSSGQHNSALEGMHILKQLLTKAQNRIAILPGGGIRAQNVINFKNAGFNEIHASASNQNSSIQGPISMQDLDSLRQHQLTYSDTQKIKEILTAVNH